MSFAQFVHTTYEACVIAATSGSAVLLVWQRRRVFGAVREFVAGVVALVHIRTKLELIVKELTTNGGSSIKDRVTTLEGDVQTMRGDVQTLKGESTRQIEILEGQNGVLQEMKQQNQEDLQELRDSFKDLNVRFSRFVKHEADNDLHYSRLAEEERRRAGELDKNQ